MTTDLEVEFINQQDPRLGRQLVHDERSRMFAMSMTVDRSTWVNKKLRIYDPIPNPNQTHGNCTGCEAAMSFNMVGNRKRGKILNMADADKIYELATTLDPWEGSYPPNDTGSSGLAAAKAAQQLGYGGEYRWIFGGVDEVVQTIMDGEAVGLGTEWTDGGFHPKSTPIGPMIEFTGPVRGGHEYLARGYNVEHDWLLIRCWWGAGFRDVWVPRAQVGDKLLANGDAKVQKILP